MSFTDVTTFLLNQPCVYLLRHKGEVVYVGQTVNIVKRIRTHRNRFYFDQVEVMAVPASELKAVEDRYITRYKPKHNKSGIHCRNMPEVPVDLVALGLVKPKASWRRF